MKPEKTLNSQNNLEQNNKTGDITGPDFKIYYKPGIVAMCLYS
jgi:hypothetical protein